MMIRVSADVRQYTDVQREPRVDGGSCDARDVGRSFDVTAEQ
ncbi:MAG: hypothetical protein ACOC0P_06125 [Planctomycetota bacterium]